VKSKTAVSTFAEVLKTDVLSNFEVDKFNVTHIPTGVALWIANGFWFYDLQTTDSKTTGNFNLDTNIIEKVRLLLALRSFKVRLFNDKLAKKA